MKNKKIIIPAVSLALGVACVSGAYMAKVISDAKKNYDDECDWLLILGGDIYGADTPSPQLFERMKRAAQYLNEHPGTKAIPCGGCFRKEQKKSEAAIIAGYLVANGVDESRIFLEDSSTTTFENFIFAKKIIEEKAGESTDNLNIGFLTSSYHIHRAGIIAKRCGFINPALVSAVTPGDAYKRYVRELFVATELIYHR